MGQTLSEPITKKETALCENSYYKVGSSSMQGWRINMEDAHTHILSLPNDSDAAFFAVYDGHGGSKVSQYASVHLHQKIVENQFYGDGKINEAIKCGFLSLDEQMLKDDETKEDMSGTTAITVLIKDSIIYCGNVGDSRAVASVSGRALSLSYDHKPSNDEESKRIFAAGGWVEYSRVNGNLALSRALGDFGYKQNEKMSAEEQIVTADPEITTNIITPEFEFIVLACDGIWDVLSNQEVVNFCRSALIRGHEPEKICENLLDRCLAPDCDLSGLGCDNMTVVLVLLLQNKSWEDYLQTIIYRNPIVYNTDENEQTTNNIQKLDFLTSTEVDEDFLTPSQSPIMPTEIPVEVEETTIEVNYQKEDNSENVKTNNLFMEETNCVEQTVNTTGIERVTKNETEVVQLTAKIS